VVIFGHAHQHSPQLDADLPNMVR